MAEPRRLIDWAALHRLEPDLPRKLNAAFFSAEARVRELRELDAELADLIEQLQADVELPAVGPGAGTYGGGGDFVESVEVDDEGRVLDINLGRPAKVAGSIFSMTGPTGATPIVAYDFTRFDTGLTVAQNLVNANQSGNSAFDLVQVGAAAILYQEDDAPLALHPFSARGDGGALRSGGAASYAETPATAALQLTAAMSAEWLGYVPTAPGAAEDCYLYWCAGSGETEAVNQLYALYWNGSGVDAWATTHESGAGTNSDAGFHVMGVAKFATLQSVPAMFTLTRAAGGSYKLYVNGHLAADADTASPTALPTGGTSSKLAISAGSTSAILSTLGFRLFGAEL
ncbi:MAG TPA: hypothetical protein VJ140_19610, partial [Actinomycetota bacterium]|nr:hypothetical protein [Actinomycetota bacterium]